MLPKWKSRLLIVAIVVGLIWYGRHHTETLGDRQKIALHLQVLKKKVQENPADKESLNEIIKVLNGNWPFARTYAVGMLRELGPLASSAIPDLILALNCGDRYVEREAARALGAVAIGRAEPVPALIKKMQNEHRDSAWFSAESLGSIGEPALVAIDALEKAAKSSDSRMADSAQKALKRLRGIKAVKGLGEGKEDSRTSPCSGPGNRQWTFVRQLRLEFG